MPATTARQALGRRGNVPGGAHWACCPGGRGRSSGIVMPAAGPRPGAVGRRAGFPADTAELASGRQAADGQVHAPVRTCRHSTPPANPYSIPYSALEWNPRGGGECAGRGGNGPSYGLPDCVRASLVKQLSVARRTCRRVRKLVISCLWRGGRTVTGSDCLPVCGGRCSCRGARAYGQAGPGVRGGVRMARAGAGKAGAARREKARGRTVIAALALRDEMPGKLARKYLNSRQKGVDCLRKGEIAS
jgi:hypothetical protein